MSICRPLVRGLTRPLVRSLVGGRFGFDLLSLNPTLWLDASRGVLDESDAAASLLDAVATWEDQSGNDIEVTQTVATARPEYYPLINAKGYVSQPYGVSSGVANINAAFTLTGGDFTISVDAYLTDVSNGFYVLGGSVGHDRLGINSSDEVFGLGLTPTALSRAVTTGKLINLTFEKDGNTFKVLEDGVELLSTTVNLNISSYLIQHIGGHGVGSSTGVLGGAILSLNVLNNGSEIFDVDFSKGSHGATSITADTGQTVTISGVARLVRKPHLEFDGVDDHFDFTLAEDITAGTVVFITSIGSYAADVSMTVGDYSVNSLAISTDSGLKGAVEVYSFLLFDSVLTEAERERVINDRISKVGGKKSFEGVASLWGGWTNFLSLTSFPLIETSSNTSFLGTWFNCTSLTSFPLIDASSGINFNLSWRNCTSLTSFPPIDISSGRSFLDAWRTCTSLTSFPANMFDSWNPTGIVTKVFHNSWDGCTSLTPQSVENILVSIDTSGKHATNDGTPGGTALADAGIDIDYDGTGLTAATTTAITSLKSKGWEIVINGVTQ